MQRKSYSRLCQLIEQLECRRLLSAGSLDTSFSGDGKADAIFDTTTTIGNAMAVQLDGKIVEAGDTFGTPLAIVRFNSDGTLDSSFGPNGNGKMTLGIPFFASECSASAIAIQSDGKIIIGGRVGLDELYVARLLPNGSLDSSFNGSGFITLDDIDSHTGAQAETNAIAIQKDGKIVVVGKEWQGVINRNANIVVCRLNTNGTLDKSFNGSGEASIDLGEMEDGEAVAIDYNGTSSTNSDYGKIVVVGHHAKEKEDDLAGDDPNDTYSMVIARFNTNGTLDKTFNGSGVLNTTAGAAKSTDAESVAIESGGAIVVAGTAGQFVINGNHQFLLARFTSSGKLDTTFGTKGVTLTSFNTQDAATSVVIGGFGNELIVGGTSNNKFALAGYNLNGVLDNKFGTSGNGKVTNSVLHTTTTVQLALAPNHTIVAAGGYDFNTARYFDIGPDVHVAALDSSAGPTTIKRVGKFIEQVPNNGSIVVVRDENLNVATRVYFTLGGTALTPNAANIKLKRANYTLNGMTISPLQANGKTGYVDIPAGQTSVTVTLIPENIPAGTQTATFSINSNSGYAISSPATQAISIIGTNPAPTTFLTTTADAYVEDGSNANFNFGTSTKLEVKEGATGVNRITYLKFDLSSLSSVNSVKLNLFGELSSSDATNVVTQLFSAAYQGWTENGVTFNSAPPLGSTALGSATIANTTPTMYTFDVTAYVKAQLAAGNKTITFALKNPSNSTPYVTFNSKESGSNAPTLSIA